MITKFNAGNISPFCEGFLNNIYDGAQRMIEDRLNHPEHGEMDARFVKEAVESSWAAEMSSQYAPLLLSMLQSGQRRSAHQSFGIISKVALAERTICASGCSCREQTT